jgi:type IV secretory pathway ATPase VirB11/archaellum biosynthesis ATPase
MPFAIDYRFNQYASGIGREIAVVESFGIRTRVFAVERVDGFEFRLHDDIHYPDIIACADWGRLLLMLAQGASIERLTRPNVILKAVPRRLLRGVGRADLREVASELANVFIRWYTGFGVLSPILEGEGGGGLFTDINIDAPAPDGSARVFVRGVGFGDSYHPLIIEPNQCPSHGDEPSGILGRLASIFKTSRNDEAEPLFRMTFNDYIIERASEATKTPVTSYAPAAMASHEDLRFTIVSPPIGNAISIRLHPAEYWTLPKLIALGSITPSLAAKLLVAVTGDEDYVVDGKKRALLVIGEMGSGKTTLTAALANTLPVNKRVVFIQDVNEYRPIPIRSEVPLNTRSATGLGVKEITKANLIDIAMRSGADFMTVNEVLNPEDARAWVLAVTSGHSGFTTIHAGDLGDLVRRLRGMGITDAEELINNNIIVLLMVDKRAVKVWWPRGLKWCPNQEPCSEEAPFEAKPYPEVLANALIKASLTPLDYEAIRQVWLEYKPSAIKPVNASTEGLNSGNQQQWGSSGIQTWLGEASNNSGGA